MVGGDFANCAPLVDLEEIIHLLLTFSSLQHAHQILDPPFCSTIIYLRQSRQLLVEGIASISSHRPLLLQISINTTIIFPVYGSPQRHSKRYHSH